ncbi:MAG: patatin-like phospholipase family protein [Syntrophales bacterium]|nr:patatin-like phospholipase family protein [Syntrophales bacterium]
MKSGRLLFLFLMAALMVSCRSATGPQSFAQILDRPDRPKIALVLGGGAARGFAHVGVIRALEQGRIPIDMVVGTSVGSLIGAIYASDLNSFELEWTAFALEKDHLLDYGLMTALTGMGTVKGDKLENFVKARIPVEKIEDLKLPYAAVATDLNRGTRVVLRKGSIARAVRASSAIPGVFQPVEYQDKLLVDGGVVDNIPISVAREMGADIVIAVDIGENVTNFNITNIFDVILQSVYIMFNENTLFRKKDADVLITPALGTVGMFDFTRKKQVMQAGIDATQKALPEIVSTVEKWMRGEGRKR